LSFGQKVKMGNGQKYMLPYKAVSLGKINFYVGLKMPEKIWK
tara:strand:+ start:697 stop:822 length:126 start_codon:yes stop_codon:yes gene_type:complete